MKKFFAPALAVLMLAASLSVAPNSARAQGPGLISSILNKMDRNRRSLSSLRSGLVMQKYNAQLRDYESNTGDVQYIAGKSPSVRVDWRRPAELLAVSNGEYTLYRPRLNQAYKGSAKSQQSRGGKMNNVLGFALSMSGSQVKSQFNIDLAGEGTLENGGPHVWWLKLTPRGAAGYQFAEIWVTDDGMPIQARVTEKNGDSTLVRLTNIQRNAAVPGNVFDIQLPAGTKIVRG